MMGKFLTTLSGARPEILEQCPTEQLKFQSLGWAILITSATAVLSMWFALVSAVGLNAVLSCLIALMWGVVITGIDRWLVVSIPTNGSRRWAIAMPRLALAVLLGTLISTPLVLRIFQSEIDAQITVMKQQQASEFLALQQNSEVGQRVTNWSNDVNSLEKVIDSRGNIPFNPSTDPQIQSLTRQRTSELTLQQRYYKQWQCEVYGGTGCTAPDNGSLAQASEKSYEQATAQVTTLTSKMQDREAQLSESNASSDHARYEQAVSALPAAKMQLNSAIATEDAIRNNFETQNNADNGLLARLQALSQLTNKNFTLNSARFLLFLLFLVIECLPVTVKMLQQPGNYEMILNATAERELKEARRAMRARPRVISTPFLDLAKSAGMDVIWQRDTQRMVEKQGETSTPITELLGRLDRTDEDTRLDQALRGMEGIRAAAESEGLHSGSVELRYGDDDL